MCDLAPPRGSRGGEGDAAQRVGERAAAGLAVGASAGGGVTTAIAERSRHGRFTAAHAATPISSVATSVYPSSVVPTPTYFNPDAKITKAITGRMYRSGALEESSAPISTAVTVRRPCLAPPAVEEVAQHHRRGAQQQGRAEDDLDVGLGRLGVAHEMQQV